MFFNVCGFDVWCGEIADPEKLESVLPKTGVCASPDRQERAMTFCQNPIF
jgi:hypothetical protein